MLEIGLTGGIGTGKSTVAQGLVRLGTVLIDADAVVRDLQQPGAAVFVRMVEQFGPGIVRDDGTLDRGAVAGCLLRIMWWKQDCTTIKAGCL
jgi:dephospho-CoA kinase